jgi:predicted RNA-binding Zn ribbon-like protein
VAAALSLLAVESIDLLTGAAAGSLRACHAPGCVLYFVKDHPRREWCSTACGNRARAARHYRRHRVGRTGE